jgi:hypothetical protein
LTSRRARLRLHQPSIGHDAFASARQGVDDVDDGWTERYARSRFALVPCVAEDVLSPRLLARTVEVFTALKPLLDWLNRAVLPSRSASR